MYVCMFVCMYVYMCLYVFICVYMCVYVCICVCAYYTIYVRIYKHITPVTPDIYQSTSSGFHRRFDSTPQVVEHHGSVRSCWQATDHADVKLRIALHCRTGSQRCNHKAQKRPDEKVQENFYLGSLRQKWWKNGQWMTRWLAPARQNLWHKLKSAKKCWCHSEMLQAVRQTPSGTARMALGTCLWTNLGHIHHTPPQ